MDASLATLVRQIDADAAVVGDILHVWLPRFHALLAQCGRPPQSEPSPETTSRAELREELRARIAMVQVMQAQTDEVLRVLRGPSPV
jgi:hypothetical protein